MNYNQATTNRMQKELDSYFSYVPMLNEEQTIKCSFPEKTVIEKTVLRISLDCSNTIPDNSGCELHMMSLHEHDIKKIKKITGLKLKSFNAFVYVNRHTQLVGMFE